MMCINKKKRYLWLIAVIAWMALIFAFSHQKAEQSEIVSGSLTYQIAEGMSEIFALNWEEKALIEHAEKWQHPVRKAAHMTEYAILACLLLANMMQYPKLRNKAHLWAWAGATAYAATDEVHQLFIEGRSGELKDVCIDSTGAVIGILAAWGLTVIWKKLVTRPQDTQGQVSDNLSRTSNPPQ